MEIKNYDNRRINVERLREEGRSEVFILGVFGGAHNDTSRRPKKPELAPLQVRNVPNGMIEIYGLTRPYREAIKRLGGKWNSESQAWRFPATRIDEVMSAPTLSPQLWIGMKEEHFAEALEQWKQQCLDYGEGYQYGQRIHDRIPLDKVFPRSR